MTDIDTGTHRLTKRHAEVLRHIANGESDREIGAALHLSVSSIRSHVRHILDRLGARNRPHAVAIAMRTGELIPPPERTNRP